jgi:hypothetical protein
MLKNRSITDPLIISTSSFSRNSLTRVLGCTPKSRQ